MHGQPHIRFRYLVYKSPPLIYILSQISPRPPNRLLRSILILSTHLPPGIPSGLTLLHISAPKLYTVLSYICVVYLLYMLYFKMSCMYYCYLSCVNCCCCPVYIVVILCVFAVQCVFCCFYFRCRTAG